MTTAYGAAGHSVLPTSFHRGLSLSFRVANVDLADVARFATLWYIHGGLHIGTVNTPTSCGALDGGGQAIIFILSFTVSGASGFSRPFPPTAGQPGSRVSGNSVSGNVIMSISIANGEMRNYSNGAVDSRPKLVWNCPNLCFYILHPCDTHTVRSNI